MSPVCLVYHENYKYMYKVWHLQGVCLEALAHLYMTNFITIWLEMAQIMFDRI